MNQNNFASKDDIKGLEKKIDVFADQIISATGKGFEEVNGRLDKVENRLTHVENRLTHVENRLTSVEEGLQEVKSDLRYQKDNINSLKADTPSKQEFQNHEKRISRLEKTTFPHQSL